METNQKEVISDNPRRLMKEIFEPEEDFDFTIAGYDESILKLDGPTNEELDKIFEEGKFNFGTSRGRSAQTDKKCTSSRVNNRLQNEEGGIRIMIKITTVNMKNGSHMVELEAPYHPNLPKIARDIGGTFSSVNKCWYFDARDEERVKKLALLIYGTDGENLGELVTTRIDMDMITNSQELWMFGRQVARRWTRDCRVKLGMGVIVVEGGFPSSGGSGKYPTLNAFVGTVLEVRDVPRELAEKRAKENPDLIEICS